MCACNCNRCCCRCCCCNGCCNGGNGDTDNSLPSLPGQGSGSSYPVWLSIPAFLSPRDAGTESGASGSGSLSCLRCLL